jgi:hypothetical protein
MARAPATPVVWTAAGLGSPGNSPKGTQRLPGHRAAGRVGTGSVPIRANEIRDEERRRRG